MMTEREALLALEDNPKAEIGADLLESLKAKGLVIVIGAACKVGPLGLAELLVEGDAHWDEGARAIIDGNAFAANDEG